MDGEYELFERRTDGSLTWRGVVQGLEQARVRVRLLANETDHECFAMCMPTKKVVLRVDAGATESLSARKRVFQIGYEELDLSARGRMLRRLGYTVVSVFGNDAAKAVLRMRPHVDLFVIGSAAPDPQRLEMAHWLRTTYPDVSILALNPPDCVRLGSLQLNAPYNAPETWLPLVTSATQSHRLAARAVNTTDVRSTPPRAVNADCRKRAAIDPPTTGREVRPPPPAPRSVRFSGEQALPAE